MKSVLITGCSSGLGRGMVDEFLLRGWYVFCTMRNVEERGQIFADIQAKYPDKITLLNLEVTDASQRDAVVKAVQQSGGLDCLINNAGFGLLGALENVSESQFRYQMEVNFYAPVFLTRALLPLLRQQNGNVIFISSVCGNLGFPLMAAYCASKHAIEGLAESLYYELEPHGVDVTLLELGLSKTNFGKNTIWGIGQEEAYRQHTENYHQWKASLSAKAKDKTLRVALRVADIAEGKRRHLRDRVDTETNLTSLFERILPEKIWVQAMKLFYRQNIFVRPR